MRDSINAAIEVAVEALLPLRRDNENLERSIALQVRNVVSTAGGPDQFISWVNEQFDWRFNVAEAPSHLHGNRAELADYVVRSIIEELLDRHMAQDKKEGR